MNLGLDLGYSATKVIAGDRRVAFPSITGTPDRARFSINGAEAIILEEPHAAQVGAEAVRQSRFIEPREDRHWIESEAWYTLFLAALTEITSATRAELNLVTGLPVAFYDDRATVRERLLGEHRAQRRGRHAQVFVVSRCTVVPQPFGTVLSVALNDQGRIVDELLATGTAGIIDVGGKTTNILAVDRLREIRDETTSVSVGAWSVVRALRDYFATEYPGLEDLRGHEIIKAVIDRSVRYYGETIDLTNVVGRTLEPLASQVVAEASSLWNGGATLDAILVAGGGALLLEPYIKRHFRHARVVEDPIFANALGYYHFAERLARRQPE